jgi:hypothetical protein
MDAANKFCLKIKSDDLGRPNSLGKQFFRLRLRKTAGFVWYPKWAIVGQGVRIRIGKDDVMDAVINEAYQGCFIAGGFAFDRDGKARIGPDVCAEIIGKIDPL